MDEFIPDRVGQADTLHAVRSPESFAAMLAVATRDISRQNVGRGAGVLSIARHTFPDDAKSSADLDDIDRFLSDTAACGAEASEQNNVMRDALSRKAFGEAAVAFQKVIFTNRKMMNVDATFRLRRSEYLDYPRSIHIETLAVCNANCTFCPYDSLARKGEKMSMELIEKIVVDLKEIPPHVKFNILPYKVSDPFLDHRIFDILALFEAELPNAGIVIITNGHALNQTNLEKLWRCGNVRSLTVSANHHDPDAYRDLMRIGQERLIERLKMLDQMVSDRPAPFQIRLTRVGDGSTDDLAFIKWCNQEFPHLPPQLTALNDWIGQVDPVERAVPDIGCNRWFDLSITATGKAAFCCMDGECAWPTGDVREQSVLEIYNSDYFRQFRAVGSSRRKLPNPCRDCIYV